MPGWLRTSKTDTPKNPFLQADPLTRLLLGRLGLKVWVAVLLTLIVPIIPVYVMVFVNHLAMIDPGACPKNVFTADCLSIGLLKDYGWFWYQFVSWPATILFFFWFPKGIFGAIQTLKEHKVLLPSPSASGDQDITQFTARFAQSYSHPIWLLVSFIALTAFMGFYFLPAQQTYKVWTTSGWFIFWYTQLFHSFILFTVFLIAARSTVVVVGFNLLFRKFPPDVNFLHPDKAGGLFPFGNLIVKGGYFIGMYGCTLLVLIMEAPYRRGEAVIVMQPEVIPMAVLYLLFAPTLFYLALRSAHLAMEKARNDFVMNIANRYKEKINSLKISLVSSDLDKVKASTEELEQLKRIHALASDYPIWPIDTRNIIRFFTSYLAPVAFAISLAFVIKLLGLN